MTSSGCADSRTRDSFLFPRNPGIQRGLPTCQVFFFECEEIRNTQLYYINALVVYFLVRLFDDRMHTCTNVLIYGIVVLYIFIYLDRVVIFEQAK